MSKDKSSSISIWEDVSEKLESLREALSTPVDENDSSDNQYDESDLLSHYINNEPVPVRESINVNLEALREVLTTPIDEILSYDEPSEESDSPSQNDDQAATDLSTLDNEDLVMEKVEPSGKTEIPEEIVEETETDLGTPDDTVMEEVWPSGKTEIPEEIVEETETDLGTPDDTVMEEVWPSDKTEIPEEIVEETGTGFEPVLEDIPDLDIQVRKTAESDKIDDRQEKPDVVIKVKTEESIKSQKIENYWKQSETTNPYLKKVDESREKLNKSLEMARELVNRQSEELPKQEKKRFQLRFTRDSKNGNDKSNKENHSKKTSQLKPMVYEMLEPKQDNQVDQDNLKNQGNKAKQNKPRKEKTRKLDEDRLNQEKDITNQRNMIEKSRSLGVPVFVKKPVNVEQIRQLKSMLTSQNDLKILVETGSSQGRLLVISGQDPGTLLNTLGQLSIVKNTTIEDETINVVV
jgi:hypothetical protein